MSKKSMRSASSSPTLFLSLIVVSILFFFLLGCKKNEPPPKMKEMDLKVIADGFVSPITVVQPPDGSRRLFVVDQVGKIWIINADGQKSSQPFIDISGKIVSLTPDYDERGLLGLAFHPDYKSNGKFYLFYTAPPPAGGPTVQTGNTGLPMTWDNTTRISEFKVSSDPGMADM
ncbi:MAG: PQQ-dependent sugar dehydrogenase, partial [Flavisolibacter sp.]